MIMMFSALGGHLLPAFGAVAVKIWCAITTIQLWYVCLAGRNISQQQKKEVLFVEFFFFAQCWLWPNSVWWVSCCITWGVWSVCSSQEHVCHQRWSCWKALRRLRGGFVAVLVLHKTPVNLHVAEQRQVGWSLVEGEEAGGWAERVAGEACVCRPAYPSPSVSVWGSCECCRRTGEEHGASQQNGTPAWVFTSPPSAPPSPPLHPSSRPAAKARVLPGVFQRGGFIPPGHFSHKHLIFAEWT